MARTPLTRLMSDDVLDAAYASRCCARPDWPPNVALIGSPNHVAAGYNRSMTPNVS